MRVQVEGKELARIIAEAKRATSRRATLPVLSGLKIEANGALSVTGTDLETTIRSSVPVVADVDGDAVIDAKLFEQVVKANKDRLIALSSDDGFELTVSTDRGSYRLQTQSVDDYPIPALDGDAQVIVDAGALYRALSRVAVAVSTDESRQVLAGVLFEAGAGTLTLAATDSYRLTVGELYAAGDITTRVVLNGGTVTELLKLLKGHGGDVEILFRFEQDSETSGTIAFRFEGREVAGRIIEGDFPRYRQLIPEGYSNRLEIQTADAVEAVKRVALLAQHNLPVKMTLGDRPEISAHTPDIGEASEELTSATYDGEALVVAFNPEFLIEGLTVCGDTATLEVADGLKPGKLIGSDGFLYLLMPVRLS